MRALARLAVGSAACLGGRAVGEKRDGCGQLVRVLQLCSITHVSASGGGAAGGRPGAARMYQPAPAGGLGRRIADVERRLARRPGSVHPRLWSGQPARGSGSSLLGVDAPEARYIERDGAQLAFQVVGEGSVDVLVVGETAQHFDLCWTDPYIHELFERGASFSRTVYMQPRGFGLSERIR